MADDVTDSGGNNLFWRAIHKPLSGLLLIPSVSVHVVATMSIVEEKNGLPTGVTAHLKHHCIARQWPALSLDRDARLFAKGANPRPLHAGSVCRLVDATAVALICLCWPALFAARVDPRLSAAQGLLAAALAIVGTANASSSWR